VFRLSLSTFAERWQIFVGAILTVCFGVALVQSALLILVSAAGAPIPPGLPPLVAQQLSDGYTGAITLLAMTLGFATFLAVFIVSATFAFTVAQRRRDLALLRLVGASRRQLRRLLLSEAVLLGLVGTALGVPAGLLLMRVQSWLLTTLGFLPPEFSPHWQDWILGVSAGVGLLVALAGVLTASRRASKVRPLEALRDNENAARVMSLSRWFFGLLFLAGSITLVITSQLAASDGAVPKSMLVALTGSVALCAFSPLLVPLVGRIGALFARRPVGVLAQANLRAGVRRSASTAAPLVVLTGMVLGAGVTFASAGAAAAADQARSLRADLVVESPRGPLAADGVRAVSLERRIPAVVTTFEPDDDGPEPQTESGVLSAVDPARYRMLHRVRLDAGSLDALHGNTIAVGAGVGPMLGDRVSVGIGGAQRSLRVVAVLSEGMSAGDEYLVPSGFAGRAAGTEAMVDVRDGTSVSAVTGTLRPAGARVLTKAEYLRVHPAGGGTGNPGIMLVLLGLSGLYAAMAVVNAVVIAAAERKREFAVARVTGFRRAAVVRMAVYESVAVAGIGVFLGLLASAGAALAIGMATGRLAGAFTVVMPLPLLGGLLAGAFLLVALTSVSAAVAATRTSPVAMLGACE
jgi:putative ABC transport system permease protein